MDIRLLSYFIAVAEELNFTEASKRLYITQSALSHNISELEKSLGVKLFERTTRSVRLTPASVYFFKNAKEIDDKLQMLLKGMEKFQEGVHGEIRVGYLFWPYVDLIAEFSEYFQKKYPDLRVNFTQFDAGELRKALEKDLIDIALGTSIEFSDSKLFRVQTIERDGISLVVRKEHPLSKYENIDLSALKGLPIVMLARQKTPGFYNFFYKLCRENNFVPDIRSEQERVEGIFIQVLTGKGVGVITTNMGAFAGYNDLAFIEIKDRDTWFCNVAACCTKNEDPAVTLLMEELRNMFLSG